jgi:hypothetical protein
MTLGSCVRASHTEISALKTHGGISFDRWLSLFGSVKAIRRLVRRCLAIRGGGEVLTRSALALETTHKKVRILTQKQMLLPGK